MSEAGLGRRGRGRRPGRQICWSTTQVNSARLARLQLPIPTTGGRCWRSICLLAATSTLAVDHLIGRLPSTVTAGWQTEGIVGQEFHDEVTSADGTIDFFTLDAGLMLGLYERTNLGKGASLSTGRPARPSSAWVSPPAPKRRLTGCSHKPKPLAAR